MEKFIKRLLLAGIIVLISFCTISFASADNATYNFSTPQGLSGSIAATGITSLNINGIDALKADSFWGAANSSGYLSRCGDDVVCTYPQQKAADYMYPNELNLDVTKVKRDIVKDNDNAFTVTHTYPNAVFTFKYFITSEDIQITTRVDNISADKYFYNLRFEGMNFNFTSPLGNELLTWTNAANWDPSYPLYNGYKVFHPSYANPVGAWYLRSNYFGVGITPLDVPWQRKVVLYKYQTDPTTNAFRTPVYLLEQKIGPGESASNSLIIRISRDVNIKHLLAPYKDNFKKNFPGAVQYKPDVRPIAQSVESASSYVTSSDPFGLSAGRRFDLVAGTNSYLTNLTDQIKPAGGQGTISWAMQGWKDTPMYTPAFDEFPQVILDNIINIFLPGYNSRGLKLGLESRPGDDLLDPTDPNYHTATKVISADDPVALEKLWGRYKKTIDMGMRLYYLDSFCVNFNHLKIMKFLRTRLNATGNNILTFSEVGSDESLYYTGMYEELNLNSKGAIKLSWWLDDHNERLALFEWLMPDAQFITIIKDYKNITLDQGWTWAYQHKITPLLQDYKISVDLINSLNAKYIDPSTNTWNVNAYSVPAAPDNFAVQNVSDAENDLSWTSVGEQTYYVIERSVDDGATWQVCVTRNNQETNFTPTYFDTGLTSASSYSYRIKAYDNFTGESLYSKVAGASVNNDGLLGDVSGNGEITMVDASLISQYGVGKITLTDAQLQRADVSGTAGVTQYDASLIAQKVVGLITKFPAEK